MSGLGQRTLPDQRIPVGGDAQLHADVYLPSQTGRYPAVISFGAYSTEQHTAGIPTGSNEIGSPPVFTDRGYAPVIIERRGMGRSSGEQVPFFDSQDTDDHEKAIAWAAEQPWCDGDVVLFGTSYYGMTQPMVAARKPPALRAFFANEICTDLYRHLIAFGGVPAIYFFDLWMGANFTEANDNRRLAPDARAAISHITNGPLHGLLEKAVHHNVDRMFRSFMSATPVEQVRELYAQWLFDAKTRDHPSIPEGPSNHVACIDVPHVACIDVPFVTVQNLGYFNLHQFGSYDLFENAGTPAGQKWLILAQPAYDLPVYSWEGEALAFFDHVLHGTDNGYAKQSAVRYWVDGANEFSTATDFPLPEATPLRLHLGSAGADAAMSGLLLSTEPTAAGSNAWAAVPIGVPVLGGLDEVANQTLSFRFAAEETLELTGPVTMNLSFSCNEIDSYVIARLSRIDGNGDRHQLSMGAIRPAARRIDEDRSTSTEIAIDSSIREPLRPGEAVTLRFSLTPAPVLLKTGESLQLDIGSRTDLLRESPSHGYAQFDLPVPPYLSRNTVHYGGASWIDVELVDRPST
jgi:putative CocE/NonD family hydrolase